MDGEHNPYPRCPLLHTLKTSSTERKTIVLRPAISSSSEDTPRLPYPRPPTGGATAAAAGAKVRRRGIDETRNTEMPLTFGAGDMPLLTAGAGMRGGCSDDGLSSNLDAWQATAGVTGLPPWEDA